MEVYKVHTDIRTNLGSHKVGELLFKEPYDSVPGTNNYYPMSGGYPMWDRNIDVILYAEKAFDTDKPKEYFINKKYSQYEVDEMLKNKQ
jgi:hypothetical protein